VAIKLLRNQNLNRKELEALQREAEIMRYTHPPLSPGLPTTIHN
jgi:hypothetical protein